MAVVHRSRPGARNYPPLLFAALAMVLLLGIMPSALNLPESNPSQTLEYAPVPPEDQNTPDPSGNFSSLGLGSSPTAGQSGDVGLADGAGGGLGPGGRAIKAPSTKRCVGTPPRQTEDPLSPPCVAFFDGNNGGATYLGVAQDEIRVVVHYAGNTQECYYDGPCEPLPQNRIDDLSQPPSEGEPRRNKFFRTWQRYFNDRYQTYGRTVKIFIYWGNTNGSPEARRAAAGEVLAKIKPFASLEYLFSNQDAFVETLARRGVMNFGGRTVRPKSTYREFPGLIWSFMPPVEYLAESFASFICTKALPHPASFSGNPGQNGQRRVFGFLHGTNENVPNYLVLAKLVKEKTEACGVQYAVDATYPNCPALNFGVNEEAAIAAVAELQSKGVTTVIQPGCWENSLTPAANSARYYPEWLTVDLRGFERSEVGQVAMDQNVWQRGWVVTPQTLQNTDGIPVEQPCLDAYLSVDPTIDKGSFEPVLACEVYDDLRQLFTGIQVAGPKLHPSTIEKGFRAIPAKPSTGPTQPSCYYLPGEYTCVKDAVAQWWDPSAPGENSGGGGPAAGFAGCYRMGNDGRRYLPGQWPEGDILKMQRDGQVCNLSNQY